MEHAPRKLWHEGPNYAADAVVIQPTLQQILLIQRQTGEWALPGGFVNKDEPAHLAAKREAEEETGHIVTGDGELVYEGPVEDPRNTEDAWIETSAYLFTTDLLPEVEGRDDAKDAKWTALETLPNLYGSHNVIVTNALRLLQNS